MPTVATEADTLKLTVGSDGSVWYLNGSGMPKSSRVPVKDFFNLDLVRPDSRVRVVGSPENVTVILALFAMKQNRRLETLEVGSPLCCESAEERKDPETVLYRMRSFNVAASLGGWHEFTVRDYTSYGLAAVNAADRLTVENAARYVRSHPSYPSLTFISDLDTLACSKVIGLILDPRWFVDTDDPNRGAKLEQFLGLDPKTQSTDIKGPRRDRCCLVMSCWKGKQPSSASSLKPSQFLWREWFERGGGSRGDLAASKKFVAYLRYTWLNEIVHPSKAGRLFVPLYFFGDVKHVDAYNRHVSRVTP